MEKFWQTKQLHEMTDNEWESLCDGCGKCCLHKLQDEDTNEVFYTRVACRLLDTKSGRCLDYQKRFSLVPDCMDIRKMSGAEMKWLPSTCAYRLRSESKSLPDWHPLMSGHVASLFKDPNRIRGRVISEAEVPEEDLEDYIIRWIDA